MSFSVQSPQLEESKCPPRTPFKQQQLPAWQPIMSPSYVIGSLFFFGALFIILGAAILVESDNLQSFSVQYSDQQRCSWDDRKYRPGWTCDPVWVNFTLTKTMKAPVYLYYSISGFHQNNRRFVRSISNTQLSGSTVLTSAEQSDCVPFRNPNDFVDFPPDADITVPQNPYSALATARYLPCGLVPWSLFNDSISLVQWHSASSAPPELLCDGAAFDALGNPTNMENIGRCEKRGVAWKTLAGVVYNPVPAVDSDMLTYYGWNGACQKLVANRSLANDPNDDNFIIDACNGWYLGEAGHRIPNPLDEDLWVWNRFASFSKFKKLYRRILIDLPAGDYGLRVLQRWDAAPFGGTKTIILENVGWIGSRNYFMGALFIAVGCVCVALAGAFLAKHWTQPPRLAS